MTKMKGQSAMEYLMTYGWAILIVIIVAAALYVLGVFNPSTFTGDTATGFSGFNVPAGGWQLDSTTNTMSVILRNQAGSNINVTQVQAVIGTVTGTNTTVDGINLGPNQQSTVLIPGFTATSAGASYSAAVTITYTNTDTGFTFTSTGTLTGTAA